MPQQVALYVYTFDHITSSSDYGFSQARNPGFHSGSSQITKSQVLCELDFTLNQRRQAVHTNPFDTTSQNHIHVLTQVSTLPLLPAIYNYVHQLRKLVEAGVSQEELHQILNQLRNLVKSTAPLAPPPPQAAPPQQWQSYSAPPLPQPSFSSSAPRPYSHTSQIAPVYPADNVILEQSIPQAAMMSTSPANIANLLSTLLKAGVVSANGTPTGAGATAKEEASNQQVVEISSLEREASRAYRQVILSHPIKLSSSDILRYAFLPLFLLSFCSLPREIRARPPIVELLYDQLTAQCKQCGIRFADTIIGKKNMEDHLDMHFRQNRKANQNVGRGHSRSWFIGVEVYLIIFAISAETDQMGPQDWIHDSSTDGTGKGRSDAHPLNPRAVAAAEAAKVDAELRSLFVVVPAGDEAKNISCPICKETLKSEFLEDDEEWVWKNAVKKDDRVGPYVAVLFSLLIYAMFLSGIPCNMSRRGYDIHQ